MTDKERINDMRRAGYTMAVIAEMTDNSISAIKVWCSRNKIRPVVYQRCLCCNKELQQMPKHKRRKFCSKKCKETWWNRNRLLLRYGKD